MHKPKTKPILIFLLLLSACATDVTKTTATVLPDKKSGVIVGRALFYKGDAVAVSYSGSIDQRILSFVTRYSDRQSGQINSSSGSWVISASVRDRGYFTATLPPGRYYFTEFRFENLTSFNGAVHTDGIATAMFEVLPGKATYIGTMKHLTNPISKVDFFTKFHRDRSEPWALEVENDAEQAKQWLHERHRELEGFFVERLATVQ